MNETHQHQRRAQRAALVDLGRHHKLFTDKFEHGGKNGSPVEGKITIEFVKPPKRRP